MQKRISSFFIMPIIVALLFVALGMAFALPNVAISETRFNLSVQTIAGGNLQPPSLVAVEGANKIAFVSDRDGRQQIYVMEADGSNQTHLPTAGEAVYPRWSPDGAKILFQSRFPGEDTSISVMYRDGSNLITLVRDIYDGGSVAWIRSPQPSWSHDGSKIIFEAAKCCMLDNSSYDVGLYVTNADGTNVEQLTDDATDHAAAWSPDGTKIAFNRTPPDENDEIYVMDANGSNVTNITNSESDDVDPAWSPDGTKIAFQYLGNSWVMDADGSHRTEIGDDGDESLLDWSPDGTWLAFTMYKCPVSSCAGNNQEIWTMANDGSNPINVTNDLSNDSVPDWSPARLDPIQTLTPTNTPTTTATETGTPTFTATSTRTVAPTRVLPTVAPSPTNTLGPCEVQPKAPKLVAPLKGAKFFNSQTIFLKWKKVGCKPSYTVQVRRDSKNGRIVASKTLRKKEYMTKPLAPAHTYYWNVTACTKGGCTASAFRKFSLYAPTPTVRPTSKPPPTNTPRPTPTEQSGCSPSYPTVCIPPPPPDLDCGEIPYRNFQVLPPDPHRFDGDHDGIGCES